MRYLLDTDIASYLLRPDYSKVRARFEQEHSDDICISAITCAELLFGMKRLPVTSGKRRDCILFLRSITVEPWDEMAAENYAEIAYYLSACGMKIGEFDTQIAAHAMALKCTLVTNNTKHFKRIPELKVENWTK